MAAGAKMVSKVRWLGPCILLVVCLEGTGGDASAQVSQKFARTIMGRNFLGVEEVAEHFGLQLTGEERKKIRQVPFSEQTLLRCKDSHILFLGVGRDANGKPLTIERLRELFPASGQPRFRSYPKSAQSHEGYATRETPHLRWYLIARDLREESRSKPHWQQEQFLREGEYRETAVAYVYMMLLMSKARGERLFQDDLVWCKSAGSDGAPVAAGYFGLEGLYVSDWWLRPDSHFGMAPACKPDSP